MFRKLMEINAEFAEGFSDAKREGYSALDKNLTTAKMIGADTYLYFHPLVEFYNYCFRKR